MNFRCPDDNFDCFHWILMIYTMHIIWIKIFDGIEYEHHISLNIRIMADHVIYGIPEVNFSLKVFKLGMLTHWGRVTHICFRKLTTIGSENGLSPERRQAIIWINAGILLIGPLGTNFDEIYIEILTFSFKKMCLKVSSAKLRPFWLGLNVLRDLKGTCDISPRFCQIPICIFFQNLLRIS